MKLQQVNNNNQIVYMNRTHTSGDFYIVINSTYTINETLLHAYI